MKYFIADTHFYHEAVIEFSNRPFENVEEMNRALINNWNSVVKSPKDEVYILGDFVYKGTGAQANQILKKLRGKKYLVKGNHEKYLNDPDFDLSLFEWVKDYYSFKENKVRFVLFHYPILEWDGYYKQSIHLYGHVHNSKPDYFAQYLGANAVNVGVDMIHFAPISMVEVLALVDEREQSL
ncbi:hydrolase [Enterococcus sp. JM4C]|uniref:metallophosphoesterase n=1 Tax=Candidatus Enterococcus huntleyi TaxID=1857217 RepID=UPI00137A96DE|nr:metallophosphoesterase [Enterococcus sp. JM4C]KAF1298453.1 hydrolase [Enterococcus sp. JM4C]